MSSTNVHSDPYIVCGDIKFIARGQPIVIMQKHNKKGELLAGKGPSILEVIKGTNTVIPAAEGIAAKNDKGLGAIAICRDGTNIKDMDITDVTVVKIGKIETIEQAIKEREARASNVRIDR